MQVQEFEYEQFFAANDISWPCVVRATDDDDDEPIDDLPPPAWFRRREERDPFPPCEALLCWPSDCPVEGDADLGLKPRPPKSTRRGSATPNPRWRRGGPSSRRSLRK